jgi:hypothetical protein|nr:MAG TPA: hypothetical protein [Caudoviricetes sp.]
MVNNFKQISNLLSFRSDDDFYFLQLIQRKKEHEELGSNNRVINTYFIRSKDHLLSLEEEIKAICDVTKSRAYINLNRRSFRRIGLATLKNITDHILNEDYNHIYRAYTTVCGQYKHENSPTFIVDIDEELGRKHNDMIRFIESECEPIGPKYVTIIPTKNGSHIIMRAFNLQKFREKYPDVDVHKNNPTILYCP